MSRAKRGATDLCGVLAVDKPWGMTSHDVIARLRRITGEGRIGHAGTLDPAATGLLLVCIGPACRLSDALMMGTKTYEARIAFGAATDTDDAEGSVIAAAPVPSEISDEGFARGVLADFVGEQQQIPPQFAAIKQDGKKAYKLARAGMHVELKPRTITIHALRLIAASPQYWDIEADVSKGTYIRALARDLGVAVGSKAHIASLRRTRSGSINMDFAQTLENLEQIDIQTHFLPPSVISISPDTPRPPVIPPVTSDAPSVTLSAAKGLVSDPRINTTVVAQPRVSRSRS